MQRETFHLSVGSKEYPAVLVVPPALRSSGLVIATHGAGGDHNIKSLEHLSEYLVGRGFFFAVGCRQLFILRDCMSALHMRRDSIENSRFSF